MKIFLLAISLVLAEQAAMAQSPTPVIVQPASVIPTRPAQSLQPSENSASVEAEIRLLEQIKSANDEILAKQKAALERLEEMQQLAEQLRIFAARG
jgi:hypothetical protein